MTDDVPPRAPASQTSRSAWVRDNGNLVAIIGSQLLFFATLMGTMLTILTIISGRFTKVENQIQASDSNRQADNRAINARVDAVQGQISFHSHP